MTPSHIYYPNALTFVVFLDNPSMNLLGRVLSTVKFGSLQPTSTFSSKLPMNPFSLTTLDVEPIYNSPFFSLWRLRRRNPFTPFRHSNRYSPFYVPFGQIPRPPAQGKTVRTELHKTSVGSSPGSLAIPSQTVRVFSQ